VVGSCNVEVMVLAGGSRQQHSCISCA
jgi:hypothetical protein